MVRGGSGLREVKYTDVSLTDEQLALIGVTSLSMPEQYIQVKDARYTLDEFNRIGELLLGRNLNDDQQVVLEWLKQYREEQGENPLNTVFTIIEMYSVDPSYDGAVPLPTKVKEAYKKLNDEQEFQVLAAFAEWGSNNL